MASSRFPSILRGVVSRTARTVVRPAASRDRVAGSSGGGGPLIGKGRAGDAVGPTGGAAWPARATRARSTPRTARQTVVRRPFSFRSRNFGLLARLKTEGILGAAGAQHALQWKAKTVTSSGRNRSGPCTATRPFRRAARRPPGCRLRLSAKRDPPGTPSTTLHEPRATGRP